MFDKKRRYSFRKGLPKKAISTQYFTFRYGEKGSEIGRNAVVVSKKVFKSAVDRNKIKRKVLSLLKENMGEKIDSYDIVVYLKPQQGDFDNELLEKHIIESINKI